MFLKRTRFLQEIYLNFPRINTWKYWRTKDGSILFRIRYLGRNGIRRKDIKFNSGLCWCKMTYAAIVCCVITKQIISANKAYFVIQKFE